MNSTPEKPKVIVGLIAPAFGHGNMAVLFFLNHVLDAALRDAGIQFTSALMLHSKPIVISGYEVSNCGASLETIRRELERIDLWHFAGTGYWDAAEGFWRPVAGLQFDYGAALNAESIAAAQRDVAELQSSLARASEVIRSLQPPEME